MEVYRLLHNIEGEAYRGFIACCLEHAKYFSFTFHGGVEYAKKTAVIQEVEKYHYKSFQTYYWFAYHTIQKPLYVSLYHSNPSLTDFFVEYFGSIFSERWVGVEDICFLNEDGFLFGSVTHEGIGNVFVSSEQEKAKLDGFGKWEKLVLSERDYFNLPKLEAFL